MWPLMDDGRWGRRQNVESRRVGEWDEVSARVSRGWGRWDEVADVSDIRLYWDHRLFR
jgi:hypothetical protein